MTENHEDFWLEAGGATACVSSFGGQVLSFQAEVSADPVLWLSPDAVFDGSIPIRGGIPICWPWFGPHPTDAIQPNHGYARTALWQPLSQSDGMLELRLSDTRDTPCEVVQRIVLEENTLSVELTTANNGGEEVVVGGALHSYFHVGDIARTQITGVVENALVVGEAIDQQFHDHTSDCVIRDAALDRAIHIKRTGSRTVVVWNPWKEGAEKMNDFSNDGYREMICLEAVNTGTDLRKIQPGESHTLGMRIWVESPTGVHG